MPDTENKTVKTEATSEQRYTREALAASKKYRNERDIIMCALASDDLYTESEAKAKIDAFLKNKVEEKIN